MAVTWQERGFVSKFHQPPTPAKVLLHLFSSLSQQLLRSVQTHSKALAFQDKKPFQRCDMFHTLEAEKGKKKIKNKLIKEGKEFFSLQEVSFSGYNVSSSQLINSTIKACFFLTIVKWDQSPAWDLISKDYRWVYTFGITAASKRWCSGCWIPTAGSAYQASRGLRRLNCVSQLMISTASENGQHFSDNYLCIYDCFSKKKGNSEIVSQNRGDWLSSKINKGYPVLSL